MEGSDVVLCDLMLDRDIQGQLSVYSFMVAAEIDLILSLQVC